MRICNILSLILCCDSFFFFTVPRWVSKHIKKPIRSTVLWWALFPYLCSLLRRPLFFCILYKQRGFSASLFSSENQLCLPRLQQRMPLLHIADQSKYSAAQGTDISAGCIYIVIRDRALPARLYEELIVVLDVCSMLYMLEITIMTQKSEISFMLLICVIITLFVALIGIPTTCCWLLGLLTSRPGRFTNWCSLLEFLSNR